MAQASVACKRALADATALCPDRDRSYDGIMGDAAHQKRKSDHIPGTHSILPTIPSMAWIVIFLQSLHCSITGLPM